MKNQFNWTSFDVKKVLNEVTSKTNSVDSRSISDNLSNYFGSSINSVEASRKSISLILLGKSPSKTGGCGSMFTQMFIDTVNEWYTNDYKGPQSMKSLSYKF